MEIIVQEFERNYIIYALMFIAFVLFFFVKKSKFKNFLEDAPATIGMMGTFWGICLGLKDFNISNIEEGIPTLLDGMKTAFYTSLAGIFLSFIIKGFRNYEKEKTEDEKVLDKILEQLEKLNGQLENTKEISKNQNISLVSNLKNGMATSIQELSNRYIEDKESRELMMTNMTDELKRINSQLLKNQELSNLKNTEFITLVNNLKLEVVESVENLRKDYSLEKENRKNLELKVSSMNDNMTIFINEIVAELKNELENINKELKIIVIKAEEHNDKAIEEFRNIGKTLAESNSKEFIKALNSSMKNLNNQLTEQFGENFKELNKAVYKLVEWQEKYKNTVVEVTENQKVIFQSMNTMKNDLGSFVTESNKVNEIAINLNNILDEINKRQEEFNGQLKILAEINISAKELIPSFKELNETINTDLESLNSSFESINQGIKRSTSNLNANIEKTNASISKMVGNFEATNNKAIESNNNFVMNLEKTNENINEMVGNFKIINKQAVEYNKKFVQNIAENLGDIEIEFIKKLEKNLEVIQASFKGTVESLKDTGMQLSEEGTNIFKKTAESLESVNKELGTSLRINSENLSNQLEITLNESLTSLGKNLVTITNRFADDYKQIAEMLKEIIDYKEGWN